MGNVWRKCGWLTLTVWTGLGLAGPSRSAAQQTLPRYQNVQFGAGAQGASVGDSISSSMKRSIGKFTKIITPNVPVKAAPDAISLSTKAAPSPKLYLSVAELYEQSGRLSEAAKLYQKALRQSPRHLGALLAYARLKDRLEEPDEAAKLYQRAARAYPNEASVFNNLGAFYGRHGKLDQSVAALQKAVQLRPEHAKYRNNLAIVLVEMGRRREAFEQLRAVSKEAVAYYNLGFLLSKKGELQAAAQHFATALRLDPSMTQASEMLRRMQVASMPRAQPPMPRPIRPPVPPPNADLRIGSRSPGPAAVARPQPRPEPTPPAEVRQLPPPPPKNSRLRAGEGESHPTSPEPTGAYPPRPDPSTPRRLPPTTKQPVSGPELAPLPAGTLLRLPTPAAPLPPGVGAGP